MLWVKSPPLPERVILSMHNDNTEVHRAHSTNTSLVLDVELQGPEEVTLACQMWDTEQRLYASRKVAYQSLGNGHVLQNHGATPRIEEYDKNGSIVMRARFGYDSTMQTYRTYPYPWVGRPSSKPDVAACSST